MDQTMLALAVDALESELSATGPFDPGESFVAQGADLEAIRQVLEGIRAAGMRTMAVRLADALDRIRKTPRPGP